MSAVDEPKQAPESWLKLFRDQTAKDIKDAVEAAQKVADEKRKAALKVADEKREDALKVADEKREAAQKVAEAAQKEAEAAQKEAEAAQKVAEAAKRIAEAVQKKADEKIEAAQKVFDEKFDAAQKVLDEKLEAVLKTVSELKTQAQKAKRLHIYVTERFVHALASEVLMRFNGTAVENSVTPTFNVAEEDKRQLLLRSLNDPEENCNITVKDFRDHAAKYLAARNHIVHFHNTEDLKSRIDDILSVCDDFFPTREGSLKESMLFGLLVLKIAPKLLHLEK